MTAKVQSICQLTEQMNGEPDYLTTYQIEFNQEQEAQAAKRKAQREASATGFVLQDHKESINRTNGLKTTGKMELRKHDKNVSNLYYLLESQAATELGIADPPQRMGRENSEEHFQFGTYHWKRCDVTKDFHPGLCYR
jgi:predicted phosphoadenosine phosphosulfate sulfurtransferase